jgi:hypothetical protein
MLRAFDVETRNQVKRVFFTKYGEGVGFTFVMPMVGKFIFESIQDVDAVFPKIEILMFGIRIPRSIVLDDSGNQKFRELEHIIFCGNVISGPFSLTLLGTFDSLKCISFRGCREMNTLVFSGETLTAIEKLEINDCRNLVDVAGIWDGGNSPLGRNSFKKLKIKNTPFLNVANLNTWLISHATKCKISSFGRPCKHSTTFYCRNNGHQIRVRTDRRDLKPSDLNALTDMNIWAKTGTPSVVNIPFRRNTQHPWNINAYDCEEISGVIALEFYGPSNAFDAEVISRQNSAATGEKNAENISGFQMNITYENPVEKIIFNDAPWEPVAIALTKKNPLFTVEFANLNAVPEELLLKGVVANPVAAWRHSSTIIYRDTSGKKIAHLRRRVFTGGAANPVAPEPHGLEIIIDGNSEAVDLWRKGGVGHYLAVGKPRDVSDLEHAGWQKVRREEINEFGGGILFRRENILPAPVP